jgi:Ca-activated chloride channel family protein
VLALAAAVPAASVPVARAAGTVIVAMEVSNSMAATDVASTWPPGSPVSEAS